MSSHFDPRLYALLHGGNPGDVAFYVGLCAEAGSVLELGCGAGRILRALPVADRWGVDLHPGMVELAQAAVPGATIQIADMRAFDLGRRFDRVILPYNALYCATDDAEAIAILRCAARHLAPDGLIGFDGYQVDIDPEDLLDDDDFEWIERVGDYDVYERDQHWPARRDCAVSYRYQGADAAGADRTHAYTIAHHYQTPWTIADLLADAGLRCVAMWGDFDQVPVEEGDRLVVLATHAFAD